MSEQSILEELIRQRIDRAGGFLPFDRFMEAALYEPGLGYYERGAIFGAEGDFVTAPDLGPWLKLGFCDLLRQGWQALGEPSEWILLEQGGGSGRLLTSILESLPQTGMPMPARVIEVETSEQLRMRQRELFGQAGTAVEHVAALSDLPALENVLAISNELPDAFPVRCFTMRSGSPYERGVAFERGFVWATADEALADGPAIDPDIRAAWPEGYTSEWNPGLDSWQQQLAAVIRRGFSFCVDYGYSQREYYRPNREQGTLLAHYRHQVVDEVLLRPGEQDITAHIDFSALCRAGRLHGLQPLLWMPQGAWLAQSPLVQQTIRHLARHPDSASMKQMAEARRMLLPFGMGEMFKLFIQATPGLDAPDFLARFNRLPDIDEV